MGDFASIATLVMFVIYLIGRFITIKKNRVIVDDKMSLDISEEEKRRLNIVDVKTVGDNPDNSLFITSQNGIYSLSVYHLLYDEGKNRLLHKEQVFEYSFLNVEQTLQIEVTMAETINNYELTYFTWDYRKITIPLYHNLKNGIIAEIAQPKHTYKSVLYYLFQ